MIKKLIGNTPIIKIKYIYKNINREMYAKLEYYNYTGSIKDRIIYHIITKAKKENKLKDNQPIIEATSGNTGISIAAIGALLNHEVHIFMPNWASRERIELMKLYGANVHLISKEDDGFRGAIKKADELAKKINGFRPDQFNNEENINAHYFTTAKEIIEKTKDLEAYVSGIGTGGTLIGIAKKLKEEIKNIKIIALEPENMSLLSNNKKIGTHKIEGIGDDFIPSIVKETFIDEVITIPDEDALYLSRLLAKKLGLAVGISSGANFAATIKSNMDKVITIFPDDAKKYLTTDLTKEIKPKTKELLTDLELLSIEVL